MSLKETERMSLSMDSLRFFGAPQKSPIFLSAKEAYISAKETLYLRQGALDLLNAKDSLKIPEKCVRQTQRETWY